MIEIEVDVSEFPAEAILAAVDRGAKAGLEQGSFAIAELAREIAPQGGDRNRSGGGVALKDSIQALPPVGEFSHGDLEARVAAGAPHATFVEFGTGIYRPGGSAWFVEPKKRLALRWEVPGGVAFSKGHWVDGMEPQPFLIPAMKVAAGRVAQLIADYIELELERSRDD